MGERTDQLTDFELRVWLVYRACADDFGVCPMLPGLLKGKSRRLSRQSDRVVMNAMTRLVGVGLCVLFDHQGLRYLCQTDWQDYEETRFPKVSTKHPAPSPQILGELSEKTQRLFREFHANFQSLPYAGARKTQTLTETQTQTSSSEESPRETMRGQALIVSPIAWDRKHGAVHVTEFCDWVCLPNDVVDGFAKRVTGVPFEEARAQVLVWARDVRRQWQGRIVPDGSDYEFWRHRWTETHGGSKPQTGAAAPDPLAGIRRGGGRG